MNYKIIWRNKDTQYLSISAFFKDVEADLPEIILPAWRPGRYEIQNFAQYLCAVEAFDASENELPIKKISKDRWQILAYGVKEIQIRYLFYANTPNAGGSYVDQHLLYLNPVNCLMYLPDRLDEPCTLELTFEQNQKIACSLPYKKNDSTVTFEAASYHELVDSPLLISDVMQHRSYEVYGYRFHLWVKGPAEIDWTRVLIDFQKFTKAQIDIFGEFPVPEYHFILWLLPQSIHHGVEHAASTMMTLGPDHHPFEEYYDEFLSLASHELFHAWNVKRIRPKELIPYDYSKEIYFETCFVAEGLTTLYGDWMLWRSGVWSQKQFLKEFETTIRRHFETSDTAHESLLASSFDLWLDGYRRNVPNRSVSVYSKGAIAGLILHNLILKSTANKKSLDDLMKLLWQMFGKPFIGYSLEDFKDASESIAGISLDAYFQYVINGNQSIWSHTAEALAAFEFELLRTDDGQTQLAIKDLSKA